MVWFFLETQKNKLIPRYQHLLLVDRWVPSLLISIILCDAIDGVELAWLPTRSSLSSSLEVSLLLVVS